MAYESASRQRQGWGRVLSRRLGLIMGVLLLAVALGSCAKPIEPAALLEEPTAAPNPLTAQVVEVSPPEVVQTLKQIIDAYTPQVRLLSPRPGEVFDNDAVTVRLQVRGLPLFKDDRWHLGPHVNLILDDGPVQEMFDPSEPLVLHDLAPGTHTLRVFAARPWNESFKNEGAYAEGVFHIYAPTPQKSPRTEVPLLTYNQPQGTYGAEPILLDFYLSHAPLHLIAQDDPNDDVPDWRIRCTINGSSFVFNRWQPIYLTGFKPGRNWLQLELIDDQGNPIENRFNTVVRAIDYTPGGDDSLSQLLRGELPLEQVIGLIDATYVPPAELREETAIPEDIPPSDASDNVTGLGKDEPGEASSPASATVTVEEGVDTTTTELTLPADSAEEAEPAETGPTEEAASPEVPAPEIPDTNGPAIVPATETTDGEMTDRPAADPSEAADAEAPAAADPEGIEIEGTGRPAPQSLEEPNREGAAAVTAPETTDVVPEPAPPPSPTAAEGTMAEPAPASTLLETDAAEAEETAPVIPPRPPAPEADSEALQVPPELTVTQDADAPEAQPIEPAGVGAPVDSPSAAEDPSP